MSELMQMTRRPSLAYISPLPPEKSGISDYSVELLAELINHYNIDVVLRQAELTSSWTITHCGVITVDCFRRQYKTYDRVLYHFGNSSFHLHMFELLREFPGIVVLHDFYLGDFQYHRAQHVQEKNALAVALFDSHGYFALSQLYLVQDVAALVRNYPANFFIFRNSIGVVVHSEYARSLAHKFYGSSISAITKVIAFAKALPAIQDREAIRKKMGYSPTDFIVCSFGIIGPNKASDRILAAWMGSKLATRKDTFLIFVGENQASSYGDTLAKKIAIFGGNAIHITGWVGAEIYRDYLTVADMAIQLRTNTRGETSAAVLDCMAYGIPTITNANGSMAELPQDAVCQLAGEFSDVELVYAIESLWEDAELRKDLACKAQDAINTRNSPRICAQHYINSIDKFYENFSRSERFIADTGHARVVGGRELRQLLVDVSVTCRDDLKTGIQRVVRALLFELIKQPLAGYRVEPVYVTDSGGRWHYRYARHWLNSELGFVADWLLDDVVEYSAGDKLLVADLTRGYIVEAEKSSFYSHLRKHGVELDFVIYDILPILRPDVFPPGKSGFEEWLKTVASLADNMLCISKSVAVEVQEWMTDELQKRNPTAKISWFHLGADIESSLPSRGLPTSAENLLSVIKSKPSFIMVGTIEPRKGHLQVLDGFSQLWKNGYDVNLIIIGKEGWKDLPDESRRTIPDTVNKICSHEENGVRLFWIEGVSDEFLNELYSASTCLIAASEAEGFGLPLIEAAQHGLPIIARDIPVFREVACDNAFYFTGSTADAIADSITEWLDLDKKGLAPTTDDLKWMTWKESADQLLCQIIPTIK